MKLLTSSVLLLGSMQMARAAGASSMPNYIYGVNLGSWLLEESWMFNAEWKAMGGELCDDCSQCAATTGALAKKLGQQQANVAFQGHWANWFQQSDVDTLVSLGINSVRVPMGFWIVEGLVDASQGEIFPQGAILQLKRGLRMLKAANISALLDMHAMPGVSAINSMFAGLCTNNPQFYQASNYNRALQWAAVMTAFIHLDPDFSNVYGLEAINEPIANSDQTPGLQGYYDSFVKVVRSVEVALGVTDCPGVDLASALSVTAPAGLPAAAPAPPVAPAASVAPVPPVVGLPPSAASKVVSITATVKVVAPSSTKKPANAGKKPSIGKQPHPTTTTRTRHTLKRKVKHAKTKVHRDDHVEKCEAEPTHVKLDPRSAGGLHVYAAQNAGSGKAVASSIPSAVPLAKTSGSSSDATTLTGIISQVNGLSSAIDSSNLATVMAQTLAQAGIDFRSGPARNLFSSSLLSSLSSVKVAAAVSGNVTSASAGKSGMKRHKRIIERRAAAASNGLNAGQCIVTNFHDKSWQWGGSSPANANSSGIGPQTYDQHPYYSFGGVAQPNIQSYMQTACKANRPGNAMQEGNAPIAFGEWWVQTNFDATTQNMKDFGDAQKMGFAKPGGKGWYYWSFKITTPGEQAMDYVASVQSGYLTKDPTQYFNPNVCDQYQ